MPGPRGAGSVRFGPRGAGSARPGSFGRPVAAPPARRSPVPVPGPASGTGTASVDPRLRQIASATLARGRRSPAEPSSARRGPSLRKVRVPGPVPRVPAPNDRPGVRLVPSAAGRPDARRAPSLDDRPAAGRAPSRAGGRAVRRTPSAEGGRDVRRAPSAVVPRVPSVAGGRAVRRFLSAAGGRDVRRVPSASRAVVSPRARSGADVRVVRRGPSAAASEDHAGRRRPLRHRGRRRRDRCAVPARRGRRPSGPGRSSWTRWSRPAAGSSGLRGLRRSGGSTAVFGIPRPPPVRRRRLPLAPWAFRVPQPRQPTSSICHHRTQTNEEGRSTSSGATLFTYVRRRPTLPRGPPRSTIGAEGLNFRVRNGTGCFPFAITAETLLRCHRPAWSSGPVWRPYLGNRTVDAKSKE